MKEEDLQTGADMTSNEMVLYSGSSEVEAGRSNRRPGAQNSARARTDVESEEMVRFVSFVGTTRCYGCETVGSV